MWARVLAAIKSDSGQERPVACREHCIGSSQRSARIAQQKIGSSGFLAPRNIAGSCVASPVSNALLHRSGFVLRRRFSYAIVEGGDTITAAGIVSFAAGYHADAVYSSGSALVKDTAANQFVVRASGGTYVYSNEGATAGVKPSPGSGTWASLSGRNAKNDIVPLDDASVLAKVVDEGGVALAAIKALDAKLAAKDAQIAALQAKDAEIDVLEARVRKLEVARH